MKNVDNLKMRNKRRERRNIWLSILSFVALIPILALVVLTFRSIVNNGKNDDVNSAKVMIKEIKNLRVAIDEFYKETGTFPDLSLANDSTLEKVSFDKNGKTIYFKDFLREDEIPSTPGYDKIDSSNKIHLVENFKDDVDNEGGWNYNIKTGEIHANLPNNFFEQGVEWRNY